MQHLEKLKAALRYTLTALYIIKLLHIVSIYKSVWYDLQPSIYDNETSDDC
jgi:hypothetical protein